MNIPKPCWRSWRDLTSTTSAPGPTLPGPFRRMVQAPQCSAQDDLALVRAFLANDAAAAEALAERLRCVPRILAAQNARLGRPLAEQDLADVVQDSTVVLLQKLGDYSGLGALEGWVFRICCFELMNAVRQRRRRLPLDDPDAVRADDAGAREWSRQLAREALERAIDRIGGVEAETLRLRHFEGLTFEEVAAAQQTTVPAAKGRYYRALQRLEEIMTAQEQKEELRRGPANR
jgi:RNA polymerase sigma-70 factor (ECF subfamily)